MFELIHRRRVAVVLGLYSLASLALLAGRAEGVVQSVKAAVFYLWAPAGRAVSLPLERWGGFATRLGRLMRADRRAADLEAAFVRDRLDAARLETLEAENRRLAALLSLPPWPDYRVRAARVWARDPADWVHGVLIRPAPGSAAVGDAVVALEGGRPAVLGQVSEVLPDGSARVLLLTDPFSAISGQLARSQEQGLVEGMGGQALRMNYLFSDADIRPGDEVVTAGLGGVFPPNLPVGSVVSVQEARGAAAKRALLAPIARVGRAREVLILSRAAGVP